MILLKIWWSLIAPKHKNKLFNLAFLKKIANFLKTFKNETIILVHGTWNVWHWFVDAFGLTKKNYKSLRKQLDEYFDKIDSFFPSFTRLKATQILHSKYTLSNKSKIICWWDATSEPRIISSDDLFSHFLHTVGGENSYILTDVDGVLDKDNNIIKKIDYGKLKGIAFWGKSWDVTWAMWSKVRKLFTWKKPSSKIVRIINWDNLKNFNNIIRHKKWIGTKIHIQESQESQLSKSMSDE